MKAVLQKQREEVISQETRENPLRELYGFGKRSGKKFKSTREELNELRKEFEPISKWW